MGFPGAAPTQPAGQRQSAASQRQLPGPPGPGRAAAEPRPDRGPAPAGTAAGAGPAAARERSPVAGLLALQPEPAEPATVKFQLLLNAQNAVTLFLSVFAKKVQSCFIVNRILLGTLS